MTTRVVFDTNILISALLSPTGAPFRCVALAKTGVMQSVTCAEILDEFAEKLQSKFGFDLARAQEAANEISACSETIRISGTLHIMKDDPDDDAVIECALVGNATVLLSGDKHLKAIDSYQSVKVMSAQEFLLLAL